MRWKYGNFEHARKDVDVRVDASVEQSPRGDTIGTRYRIALSGSIFGDNQSQLVTNIQALQAAYSVNGQDILFMFDDGTPTPDLSIRSQDCIGGVRVMKPPVLTPKSAAQYSTYWDYSIELEAVVRAQSSNSEVVWDFEERIEFTGTGGPQTFYVELKNAPAQAQRSRRYSMCQCTQSGTITGLNGYLRNRVPPPRFPSLLVPTSARISKQSPRKINGEFTEFTIAYSYSFESNTPFADIDPLYF